MPRNGSGTYSVSVNFTTEAASAPIEISKLDSALADIGTALTASIASDGQTSPSANLKMNGFKHTNVAAATELTEYVRVSELIDQDHIYYVDSGAADAYVITPSPAISAYEEGQKFVFRAANANTGASTLNVNSEGAIAIQTPDGNALEAGMIAAGGYYEVIYDANPATDRFVLISVPSKIDGLLSSNVPLKDTANEFTADQTLSSANPSLYFEETDAGSDEKLWRFIANADAFNLQLRTDADGAGSGPLAVRRTGTNIDSFEITADSITLNGDEGLTETVIAALDAIDVSGLAATDGIYVDDAGTAKRMALQDMGLRFVSADADQTFALGDANTAQAVGATARTYTLPANSAVAFPIGCVIGLVSTGAGTITVDPDTGVTLNSVIAQASTANRTVLAGGMALLYKVGTNAWNLSGDIS